MSIPATTVARLPRYFRCLRELLMSDVLKTSSGDLARLLDLTPSQVRADLSHLSDVAGQQGYGYQVKLLYKAVSTALGSGDRFRAILLCDSPSPPFDKALFAARGVELEAVFCMKWEGAPSVPQNGSEIPLKRYGEMIPYCEEHHPDIAVLLPTHYPDGRPVDTGDLAFRLERTGIRGIWNFTATPLRSDTIPVKNVLLADSLMTLCCEIHQAAFSPAKETT